MKNRAGRRKTTAMLTKKDCALIKSFFKRLAQQASDDTGYKFYSEVRVTRVGDKLAKRYLAEDVFNFGVFFRRDISRLAYSVPQIAFAQKMPREELKQIMLPIIMDILHRNSMACNNPSQETAVRFLAEWSVL